MIAKKLIKLSDYLDSIGLYSEANGLDKLIIVASGIDYKNEKVPEEAVIESLDTPEIEALLDLADQKQDEDDMSELEDKIEEELRLYVDPDEISNMDFEEQIKEMSGILDSYDKLILSYKVITKLKKEYQNEIHEGMSFQSDIGLGSIADASYYDFERSMVMRLEDLLETLEQYWGIAEHVLRNGYDN